VHNAGIALSLCDHAGTAKLRQLEFLHDRGFQISQ
jgi:hypothetical protein